MAFAYLLDPNQQHIDRGGSPNVHGYFKVFLAGTDDIATTYKDFSGTLNPENIPIDLNGRCVIIADSARQYRVEMYWPNGDLVYTQEPVWTLSGGGGGTSIVEVTSTDGSITIDKSTVGSRTTFDLGVNDEDDPEKLDWIRCAGSTLVDGIYVPQKSAGSMSVGEKGVLLEADMLYHAVVSITASKNAQRMAYYDKISVGLALFDGEATTPVTTASRIVDYSCGLSQEFEVCTDIKVGPVPAQLVITVSGQDVQGGGFAISRLDVHRVSSHVTAGGGSFTQVQSDWAQTNSSAVDFIKNKPSIPAAQVNSDWNASSGVAQILNKPSLATVATSGSYSDLSNKPSIPTATSDLTNDSGYITASDIPAQAQADWSETNTSDPSYIQNKPSLATVATSGSYNDLSNTPSIPVLPAMTNLVAGTNVTLTETANGLEISASSGTFTQVQSDWTQSDNTQVDFIKNKPSLASVATSGDYADLSNKPSIPAPQVQSDWDEADNTKADYIKNKPSLATVATSGSYTDLSNTPSIPTVNDGTLTIKRNGSAVGTFTANQSSNVDIDIETIKFNGDADSHEWDATDDSRGYVDLQMSLPYTGYEWVIKFLIEIGGFRATNNQGVLTPSSYIDRAEIWCGSASNPAVRKFGVISNASTGTNGLGMDDGGYWLMSHLYGDMMTEVDRVTVRLYKPSGATLAGITTGAKINVVSLK